MGQIAQGSFLHVQAIPLLQQHLAFDTRIALGFRHRPPSKVLKHCPFRMSETQGKPEQLHLVAVFYTRSSFYEQHQTVVMSF